MSIFWFLRYRLNWTTFLGFVLMAIGLAGFWWLVWSIVKGK